MEAYQHVKMPPVNLRRLRAKGSVKLAGTYAFQRFCNIYFRNFSPDRFEPVAIRAFFKNNIVLTLYAIDKPRWERYGKPHDWIPVRKFKTIIPSSPGILSFVTEFNFTLVNEAFPINAIRVINK